MIYPQGKISFHEGKDLNVCFAEGFISVGDIFTLLTFIHIIKVFLKPIVKPIRQSLSRLQFRLKFMLKISR